jgi:hypothetical protein
MRNACLKYQLIIISTDGLKTSIDRDNQPAGAVIALTTVVLTSVPCCVVQVSLAERWQRVEDVERMLGLEDVREVLVGDNFHKGISVRTHHACPQSTWVMQFQCDEAWVLVLRME